MQLNTVARPPYEVFAKPLTRKRMEEVREEIGKDYDGPVDILAGSRETEVVDKGKGREGTAETKAPERIEEEIIEMLLRRPCTTADVASTLEFETGKAAAILQAMEKRGSVTTKIHGGKKYYRVLPEQNRK